MKKLQIRKFALGALILFSVVMGADRQALAVPQKAEDITPILIGSKMPRLWLQTIDGKSFDWMTATARKPTVLIFYRGGWCPYCSKQLGQLQTIEPQLVKLGYQVLAVSADAPIELRKTLEKTPFSYTLLSDASMVAAQTLGIAYRMDDATYAQYKDYGIDVEKSSGYRHHLLPVPSVFVFGTDGVLQFSYVNPNFRVRLSPKVLLAAAEAALPEGSEPAPAPAPAEKDKH